jgi:hypothetical protein
MNRHTGQRDWLFDEEEPTERGEKKEEERRKGKRRRLERNKGG